MQLLFLLSVLCYLCLLVLLYVGGGADMPVLLLLIWLCQLDVEQCDDKNTAPGDGCDENCALEDGWDCGPEGDKCATVCGEFYNSPFTIVWSIHYCVQF